MPQFDFSLFPSQIFWLCIIFALQYVLMAKIIIPGFNRIYKTRKSYLTEQMKAAEDMVSAAEKLRSDYELLMQKTRSANMHRTTETLNLLQKEADQKLADLDKILAQNFKLYEQQHENRKAALKKDLDKIALVAAENIISKLGSIRADSKSLIKFLN